MFSLTGNQGNANQNKNKMLFYKTAKIKKRGIIIHDQKPGTFTHY